MTDNTDVRARRTRAKLVEAFHEVVRDTGLDALSVSALTRAAGVNRTSFYAHFASPEDLAIHALGELLDVVTGTDIALRAGRTTTAEEASRRALREIVDFVWERRASYARLLGPAAPARVSVAVIDAFAAHAARSLRDMPGRPADADPVVTAQFIAAGVLHVVGRWLAEPRRWSRDRLVTALIRCLPGWVTSD
jgi:AcrR family transcriptional regulator